MSPHEFVTSTPCARPNNGGCKEKERECGTNKDSNWRDDNFNGSHRVPLSAARLMPQTLINHRHRKRLLLFQRHVENHLSTTRQKLHSTFTPTLHARNRKLQKRHCQSTERVQQLVRHRETDQNSQLWQTPMTESQSI